MLTSTAARTAGLLLPLLLAFAGPAFAQDVYAQNALLGTKGWFTVSYHFK